MQNRLHLAVFDPCQLRCSAIAQVLQHSGRYCATAQSPQHALLAGRFAAIRADGALLAMGMAPDLEHKLMQVAGDRGLPMIAYRVQAAATRICVDAVETAAPPHVCVRLDGVCDVGTLLLAVDSLFLRGCLVCGHAPCMMLPMPGARLSPRESEIFSLLGSGIPCKEIASRLAISEKTVYTHTARIREKWRLADGAALLQAAIGYAHAPLGDCRI
ncbi:MAG: LuxR C-terminal-related transcriptional regulator [bacterium]